MMRRFPLLLSVVLLVLMTGPAAAQTAATEEDTTAANMPEPLPVELEDEFFERLDLLKCTDLNGFAYRELPHYVLSDRPDLLYELVLYWESRCLATEPVFRIRLLGSIWDADFDEGQYEEEVIDRLVERYDPPVKSRHPDLRIKFDDFTVTFADQLLPHVTRGSVEEFFCLYYAGKTAEAWALLESEDLEDTWLRFYYDEELAALNSSDAIPTFEITGGFWRPRGNVAFVGDKPMVGMLGGVRWPHWLLRITLEWRLGRSDEPYLVNKDNIRGLSNRFDATLFGVEFGRILLASERSNLDVFAGAGADVVKPFKDEEVFLGALNLNVGLGYRLFLGRNGNGMLGVDVRREWIDDRNEATKSMSGGAWNIRFSMGFAYNKGDKSRLKALGH